MLLVEKLMEAKLNKLNSQILLKKLRDLEECRGNEDQVTITTSI